MLDQSRTRYAFQRVWTKPHVDWNKYTEITVHPVNTENLIHDADLQGIDVPDKTSQAYAQALGTYTEQAFKEALRRYPHARLRFVDSPGTKTVILDTELVEFTPIQDGVAGSHAPDRLTDQVSRAGRIGMETELRDGTSGEVIATIGDRETGGRTPVGSELVTWNAHAEPIVDEWAMQVAGLVNYRGMYSPFRTVHHPWPAIMSWGH